jgi:hypothetical protein
VSDDFDDIVWCVVTVVRKNGGRIGLTADEVLAGWERVTAGSRPKPDRETVKAAAVVAVEQGDLRWSAVSAPDGEPRAFHPHAALLRGYP